MGVLGVVLVSQKAVEPSVWKSAFRELHGDRCGVEDRSNVGLPSEMKELLPPRIAESIELSRIIFLEATSQLEVEDGVGCVKSFTLSLKRLHLINILEGALQAQELDASSRQSLVATRSIP